MNRVALILILTVCSGLGAWAQDFNPAENKTVYSGDTTFVFSVKPLPENYSFTYSKEYYWYLNQKIHRNEGGAYGWLLNGKYRALAGSNRLVEEGSFKMGIKDGVWRSWSSAGDLQAAVKYRKGKIAKQLYPTAEKSKDSGKSGLRLFRKHKADESNTPADSTAAKP